jgi:hypothetical protein
MRPGSQGGDRRRPGAGRAADHLAQRRLAGRRPPDDPNRRECLDPAAIDRVRERVRRWKELESEVLDRLFGEHSGEA